MLTAALAGAFKATRNAVAFSGVGRKAITMPLARIGGGMVLGGAIGGIASDSNTGTGVAADVAKGALLGGAVGTVGAAIGARGLAKEVAAIRGTGGSRSAWDLTKAAGKGLLGVAKGADNLAGAAIPKVANTLKWINKNPGKTGALALGATAAVALAGSGGNVNRSGRQMAEVAEMEGRSSTGFEVGQGADRYAFQESTSGLVQGLHQSRHR